VTELRYELEEDARAALSAVQAHTVAAGGKSDETATALTDNTTFASESLAPESSKSSTVKVKKKGKPKLTPKEKKERSVRGLYSEPPAARAYSLPHTRGRSTKSSRHFRSNFAETIP
jgi:hypothetical protein